MRAARQWLRMRRKGQLFGLDRWHAESSEWLDRKFEPTTIEEWNKGLINPSFMVPNEIVAQFISELRELAAKGLIE